MTAVAERSRPVASWRPRRTKSAAGGGPTGRDIVLLSDPTGVRAESFRALRTNLVSHHLGLGRRALAVCAVSEGVGCTFVAVNLAVAMSQIGLTTLLVDADMRRPGLEAFLQPREAREGLGRYLAGEEGHFADFIQSSGVAGLSVMYAGEGVANPQELLGGELFAALMESCMREFDVTIVDTPPANRYADARRVGSVVGHSLVVARRNVTLVEDLKTLIAELNVDHAHVVGTVLNEL
jgi:protein-tyrosine kinase